MTDDGVQLVGSNEFRVRCSELSKEVEITYNNLVMPKQQNQQDFNVASTPQNHFHDAHAEGVTNDVQDVPTHRVRRKYAFDNWLMSGQNPSLQSNTRFPVSQEDIIHYSAIVELAHSSIAK